MNACGLFIDGNHRVGFGSTTGAVVLALSPGELRAFASALLNAANRLEDEAHEAASAALDRARKGTKH